MQATRHSMKQPTKIERFPCMCLIYRKHVKHITQHQYNYTKKQNIFWHSDWRYWMLVTCLAFASLRLFRSQLLQCDHYRGWSMPSEAWVVAFLWSFTWSITSSQVLCMKIFSNVDRDRIAKHRKATAALRFPWQVQASTSKRLCWWWEGDGSAWLCCSRFLVDHSFQHCSSEGAKRWNRQEWYQLDDRVCHLPLSIRRIMARWASSRIFIWIN